MKAFGLALVVGFVSSGCAVIIRGPGIVAAGPGPARPVQLSAWDEDEVHYVVFRDYFGCADADVWRIAAYRRIYSLDVGDLFFLMFVARQTSITFDAAFHAWWNVCARDHHRLVLQYKIQPSVFFVPVAANVACPPPYGRAYGYWRNRTLAGTNLSVDEYRALAAMKIGCDYYGHPAHTFFERVKSVGAPVKVIYVDHRSAGIGSKDCRGLALGHRVARPWEMDRGEREGWKRHADDCCKKEEDEHHKAKGKPDEKGDKDKPDDKGGGKGKGKGKP
ncbi:MAG TPA: hypothetical protein VI643_02685 [Planctomycetota bacterium]|nr:hypothetical protein [Planctomycetota bacterium]